MTVLICTENGYYYTTGNGRYGRTTGAKNNAETLCEKHAGEIVSMLTSAGLAARTEEIATRGCMVCQRKADR